MINCIVSIFAIISTITLTLFTPTCKAHGRLMDPPARNSMWRLGFNNPVNYNDNELYCGGRMVQWLRNNGKCGVCGDPFHGKNDHLAGGKYANGIITRSYHEGDNIPVTVHLTANHLGWFEFRICPTNDPKKKVTQKCLDKNELERADGKGTKYFVPKGKYNAFFNYTLKLPKGLTCKQCVIQWKYRTGNTWDKDDKSGLFCLGCGPQEEFYNCADIEVLPKGQKSKWTKEQNMKPTSTTPQPLKEDLHELKQVHKHPEQQVKSEDKEYINKYKRKTAVKSIAHPKGESRQKVKHPMDVKYNWRASTPWLIQRKKWLNRRRLGLKRKHIRFVKKQDTSQRNSVREKNVKYTSGSKDQNEPDLKKAQVTKPRPTRPPTTTTRRPTSPAIRATKPPNRIRQHPVSRKPIYGRKVTQSKFNTVNQSRRVIPSRRPSPSSSIRSPFRRKSRTQYHTTRLRTFVTKPPRTRVLKNPSKSWLMSPRKRIKQTTRPASRVTHSIPRVGGTSRPVHQSNRQVPKSSRPNQPNRQQVVKQQENDRSNGKVKPTHKCITTKDPPKQSVKLQQKLPQTDPPKQNDAQTDHQVKSSRGYKPTIGTQQRTVSFDRQRPPAQSPLVHRPQMIASHTQGPFARGTNSISPLWWSQYQRPVSYFWNRPAVTPLLKCRATITLGGGMDEWCTANCNANFCPGGMCVCQPEDQAFPSYSVYPQRQQSVSQAWGNTFSPSSLGQFTSQGRVAIPGIAQYREKPRSRSPYAPRGRMITRQRTVHTQPPPRKTRTVKKRTQRVLAPTPVNADIREGMTEKEKAIEQKKKNMTRRKKSRSIFSPPTEKVPTPNRRDHKKNSWGQKGKYFCRATGRYTGLKRFDVWCSKNCMNVICPLLICECLSG